MFIYRAAAWRPSRRACLAGLRQFLPAGVLPAINHKRTPYSYARLWTQRNGTGGDARCGAARARRHIFASEAEDAAGAERGGRATHGGRNRRADRAARHRRSRRTAPPRGQTWPPGARCARRAQARASGGHAGSGHDAAAQSRSPPTSRMPRATIGSTRSWRRSTCGSRSSWPRPACPSFEIPRFSAYLPGAAFSGPGPLPLYGAPG